MTIKYTLVAKNKIILAEYPKKQSQIRNTSKIILEKSDATKSTKISYEADNLLFNILIENYVIFLCVTDTEFGKRIPFAYLEKLANEYNEYNELKNDTIEKLQSFYSNKDNDKISSVKAQIDNVKNIMVKNIDKVLERGEDINTILDEVEELECEAQSFKYKSRKLKNKLWWKNFKLWIILMVIVLIVIFVGLWLLCGFPTCQNLRSIIKT